MRNVTLWIAQVLLAVFFFGAGYMHTFVPLSQLAHGPTAWTASVPVALVRFIGIVELLGAIGVILPRATGVARGLTPLAAIGLGAIMVLAIPFHIARGEASLVWEHCIAIAVCAFVVWGRRDDLVAMVPARRMRYS